MAFKLSVEVTDILGTEAGDAIVLETGAQFLGLDGHTALTDLTAYVPDDGVTLKLNTIDFALDNPPSGALDIGAAVQTQNPTWSGRLATAESYQEDALTVSWKASATNTDALVESTAPFDLSDNPVDGTSSLLLEDGTELLLEDGTDFEAGTPILIEAALSYEYGGLSVKTQTNADGPDTTFGHVTVRHPGLRPGNVFGVTSALQGYDDAQFQITQATVTFPDKPDKPVYEIEFGDTPETLAEWATVTAPAPVVAVSAPTVIPLGLVIYGKCSAGHIRWPVGGGIVTIAQATFAISAAAGTSNTVQLVGQIDCKAYAWSNYVSTPRRAVRAVISGGIFTGAWQETPAGTATTSGARGTYDLSSALGISLPDGTYTVSIQIDTQGSNQMEVFSAYAQAAVTNA